MTIVGLILLLSIAARQDFYSRKISNLLILLIFINGVFYQLFQSGSKALLYFLLQSVLVILILFPMFYYKGLGAGDVKLMSAIAFYIPFSGICYIFCLTVYLAAVFIIISGFRRKSFKKIQVPMSMPILAAVLIYYLKNVLLEGGT